jgi:hypothetical protein
MVMGSPSFLSAIRAARLHRDFARSKPPPFQKDGTRIETDTPATPGTGTAMHALSGTTRFSFATHPGLRLTLRNDFGFAADVTVRLAFGARVSFTVPPGGQYEVVADGDQLDVDLRQSAPPGIHLAHDGSEAGGQ